MLRFAKTAWLIIAGLTIATSILGLPVYYAQLSHACTFDTATCSEQLIPTATDLTQMQAAGWSPDQYALTYLGFRTFQTIVMLAIGVLIFARKSNDWGALIISLALVLFAPSDGRLAIGNAYPALYPAIQVLDFVASVSLAFLLITFPDGRVVPRVMWLMIAYWFLMWVVSYLNLLDKNSPLNYAVSAIGWLGLLLTGVAAQVYRYFRVSTRVQRQQTKWVVLGWGLFLILFLVLAVPALNDPQLGVSANRTQGVSFERLTFLMLLNSITLLLPISIGIAILRSRLWDIDVLIRRTLTYAIVTALLALVFFGSVVLLQQILSGLTGAGQSEIVTVLSTLAIAALFVPIRNRIQVAIDKRFNRNRYNVQQVLDDFANTVRDETDLEKLTARLMQVVDATMQPKSVSVWLKKTNDGRRRAEHDSK